MDRDKEERDQRLLEVRDGILRTIVEGFESHRRDARGMARDQLLDAIQELRMVADGLAEVTADEKAVN